MIKRFLFAGLALATVAMLCASCANPGEKGVTPAEGLALSCAAFGNVVESLAPMRADGTLNASTVHIVDSTKAGVDEVCLGKAPNINSTNKDIVVKNGLGVVQAIALQFLGHT